LIEMLRYFNHVGQICCHYMREVKVFQPCWPDLLSLLDRDVKVFQPCWPDLLSLHDREVKGFQPCWPDLLSLHERG
jgi:hypothetical protein